MEGCKVDLIDVQYKSGEFELKDINIRIKPGSVTGIIGKNGSGKSTILKLIHGDIKPVSGQIRVEGKGIKGYDALSFARKMSFLQQEIYNPLNFTVKDVMEVSSYARGESNEELCKQYLENLGVGNLLNHDFNRLSGGQRRLVTIAASLYQNAEILLFDEPTTFLDIDNQHYVHMLIEKLKKEGKTIILVMHELNAINRLCDEIIMLRSGRIVAAGQVGKAMTAGNLSRTFDVAFSEIQSPDGNIFYSLPR